MCMCGRYYLYSCQLKSFQFSPASNPCHLRGVNFYLALNALNFAESARPFGGLTVQQFAELYFSLGLQCHSLPLSGLFKVGCVLVALLPGFVQNVGI